jgi:hypothetical protein
VEKYAPVAAAIGVGGALIYRNHKKSKAKIKEEAASLHAEVKDVKDAVKEIKPLSEAARLPKPLGLAA